MTTEPIWETADGRRIPASRLDDDHLLAIYSFLTEGWSEREGVAPHAASVHDWVRIIVAEIVHRGLTDRVDALDRGTA